MTQKELLYIEDIYNHEKDLIAYIEKIIDDGESDYFEKTLNKHLKEHKTNLKNIEKLLSGEIDE